MAIVKTLEELVREKMNELAEQAAQNFKSSVHPIYGGNHNNQPEHIGSCTLLKIDEHSFLVTAAHIIDENEYTSLYFGGGKELQLIEGQAYTTTKKDDDRNKDHYDFAWLKLPASFIEKQVKVNPIIIEQLSLNDIEVAGRQFVALGYPNSKNKKVDNFNKSISPSYWKYSSTIKNDDKLCKKLEITGKDHYFLDFNSKYSKDNKGFRINTLNPRGMSGGPIIDMGKIASPESYNPEHVSKGHLAGILIENHKDYKIMSSVKISVVVDCIRNNEN